MKIISLPYYANTHLYFQSLAHLPGCVWLDSGRPWCNLGRFDIFSAQPEEVIQPSQPEQRKYLSQKLAQHKIVSDLPFCGGWIGYLPYEFKHGDFAVKRLSDNSQAWFGWYSWAVVVDHKTQQACVFFNLDCPQAKQNDILARMQNLDDVLVEPFQASKFSYDQAKATYLDALAKIKEYLLAGDCYQVNFSQRFSAEFSGSAVGAYLRLRQSVPSPFSAYLDMDTEQILCASPERFVRINDRQALTQPIKGTIKRSHNPAEDEQYKRTLITSEKNRAENVMIVDLLRNDFSQCCKPHSVKVSQLFEVQSFANVHHLVSSVTGILEERFSHPDLILSCFPGGSITGAPKKRAMEIIAELEPHARGPYCGSVIYFSCNDKTDSNITIRTLHLSEQKIYAWAGGGIVIDSEAEDEYQESLTKIAAFLQGLESEPST